MKDRETEGSDRAATHCDIGIPDGFLGTTIEVDATEEGLEFGCGYSTLSWDWILAAFRSVQPLDVDSRPQDHGSGTSSHEPVTPSSH